MNSLRMKTVLLSLFYLLMWCQATESLIDQQVILGESVTLDCDVGVKEITWIFLKLTDPPVVILRSSKSESTGTKFFNKNLQNKYSLKTQSRLVINNVSVDELGLYYCIKQDTPVQISTGTRIYITDAQDQYPTESISQPQQQTTNQILTVLSILLNVVLLVSVIGLLILKPRKSIKCPEEVNTEPEQFEDINAAQYSEIELPKFTREVKPSQNDTYVLLQNPKPDPRHTQR